MRKNIFGDFLSPDNRIIYGTYTNLSRKNHYQVLSSSINIAILLAGDNVIVPPFFPFQCNLVRKALTNKYEFIDLGYIVFPMRESRLDFFLDKKREEYASVKNTYSGIYSREGVEFIRNRNPHIIRRTSKMGITIANAWEGAADISESWVPIKEEISARDVDKLRKVPLQLKESNSAITWSAMREFLIKYRVLNHSKIEQLGTKLDEAIQYEYIRSYLAEYEATIISRIPPKTADFFLKSENILYDYLFFKRIMEIINIWDYVSGASALEVVRLKRSAAYNKFIRTYESTCLSAVDFNDVISLYLEVASELSIKKKIRQLNWRIFGINTTRVSHQNVEDLLDEVADKVQKQLDKNINTSIVQRKASKEVIKMKKVFLVHGRNISVRDSIYLFLNELGLNVVVMASEPHATRTLPEKFEQLATKCDYAVVIGTGDDVIQHESDTKRRVRQNVLIEIGYFWGNFGRSSSNWSLLIEDGNDLEIPSDIQGLGYIPITTDLGETKLRLRKELEAAGVI